jgi:hypothetical protein
MYKVETIDELGYVLDQQDGFSTHEQAQQEADECVKRWGGEYWVRQYEEQPLKEERVYAYPNSVDGWEDIYPQED